MSLILENEPEARFEELAGMFIASFARSPLTEDVDVQGKDGDTDTKTSTITGMKTSMKIADVLVDALSEQERVILSVIGGAPTISLQDIAAKTSLSKSGVRHHVDKFKKQRILRRIGGAKGGRWEIVLREGT